jgi:hypothetical protein
MGIYDLQILSTLFDGIVTPTALYGCEFWGPDVMLKTNGSLVYQALEEVQWLFMRMALWVGKGTPHNIMMKEMDRHPLIVQCVKRVVGFWNKVAKGRASPIITVVMRENAALNAPSWTSNMCAMVNKATDLDVCLNTTSGDMTTFCPILQFSPSTQPGIKCEKCQILVPSPIWQGASITAIGWAK